MKQPLNTIARGSEKLLREDPVLFATRYSRSSAVPPELSAFQQDILRAVALGRRLVLFLPANHGKSTLLSRWP